MGRLGSLCSQEHPRTRLPTQDFDRLLEVLRAALAKDPGTGFVFSCLSGQGRTTTAMVVAVLAFWHIRVREGAPHVGGGLPRTGATWSLGHWLCQEGMGGGHGAWCTQQSWAEGQWGWPTPDKAEAQPG